MLRCHFLNLAAACIILPALRWVPVTVVESDSWVGVVYYNGIPIHYREKLCEISWTRQEIESPHRP